MLIVLCDTFSALYDDVVDGNVVKFFDSKNSSISLFSISLARALGRLSEKEKQEEKIFY